MIRYNATVQSGFVARDGTFRHYVLPDGRGKAPVQLTWHAALGERTRVLLVDGRISEVQGGEYV